MADGHWKRFHPLYHVPGAALAGNKTECKTQGKSRNPWFLNTLRGATWGSAFTHLIFLARDPRKVFWKAMGVGMEGVVAAGGVSGEVRLAPDALLSARPGPWFFTTHS